MGDVWLCQSRFTADAPAASGPVVIAQDRGGSCRARLRRQGRAAVPGNERAEHACGGVRRGGAIRPSAESIGNPYQWYWFS